MILLTSNGFWAQQIGFFGRPMKPNFPFLCNCYLANAQVFVVVGAAGILIYNFARCSFELRRNSPATNNNHNMTSEAKQRRLQQVR